MLRSFVLQSPEQKFSAIGGINFSESLVVTGSLENKLGWQTYLLEKLDGFSGGEKVIRASELWQKVLEHTDGRWRILPGDYFLFLVQNLIEKARKDFSINILSQDRQMAYGTLCQLLPLVSHEHGNEAIKDWFSEKEQARDKWQDWYILSLYLWNSIQQMRVMPENLIPGFLINEEIQWDPGKKLILDIGLDMSSVEGELIVNLSRHMDIDVLVPCQYKGDPLSAYHELLAKSLKVINLPEVSTVTPRFAKFPSMLSEVKATVAQVRKWLDEGVPCQEIVVCSPIIENFWPTLAEYFQVEGIPVNKPVVSPLSQRLEIQKWLSAVRMGLNKARTVHAKQVFFLGESTLSFRDYKQQFENLYSLEDFERDTKFSERKPPLFTLTESLTFKDFFSQAITLWPAHDLDQVNLWLGVLDSIWHDDVALSAESWLDFLELFFARREFKVKPADEGGIRIGSLDSIENFACSKIIVVGLTQDNLKVASKTPIPLADILSIQATHGFYMDHAERGLVEKQLHWILSKNVSEACAFVAEADFGGRFQTPALFWLQNAIAHETTEVETPEFARWDWLMHKGDFSEIWRSKSDLTNFSIKLESDVTAKPDLKVNVKGISLSASTLEQYFKCPFKVLAAKGFNLKDSPPLDLDADPMSRGTMLHKICELVLENEVLSVEPEFIEKIVLQAREQAELKTADESFWPQVSRYYASVTKNFINSEISLRSQFPNAKTIALEQVLEGYITLNGDRLFLKEPDEESFPFSGKIDRIDANPDGEIVLVDYKSSDSGIEQYTKWISEGLMQMLIYSIALREGLGSKQACNVVGAYYYTLKDFARAYGLNTSTDSKFYPSMKKAPDFQTMLDEAKSICKRMLNEIKSGRFDARPLDSKICEKCDWEKICRRSLTQ